MVEGPAKGRAVRRVVEGRIRKMLGVLGEMRRCGGVAGGQQQAEGGRGGGGEMDWSSPRTDADTGGKGMMGSAASMVVGDLVRRMEGMQGQIALLARD